MSSPPPYPRIPYLMGAPTTGREDLVLSESDAQPFLREEVVVEEKLDGANVMLWLADHASVAVATRSGPGGRDRAGQLGPLRAWAARRSDAVRTLLSPGQVLYGEWLWLSHGIRYDRLPSFLVGLDLWDSENGFWDLDARDERCRAAGIPTPPCVFRGVIGQPDRLKSMVAGAQWAPETVEGLVVRRLCRGTEPRAAKVVRESFQPRSDREWAAGRARNRAVGAG